MSELSSWSYSSAPWFWAPIKVSKNWLFSWSSCSLATLSSVWRPELSYLESIFDSSARSKILKRRCLLWFIGLMPLRVEFGLKAVLTALLAARKVVLSCLDVGLELSGTESNGLLSLFYALSLSRMQLPPGASDFVRRSRKSYRPLSKHWRRRNPLIFGRLMSCSNYCRY